MLFFGAGLTPVVWYIEELVQKRNKEDEPRNDPKYILFSAAETL